MSSTGYVSDKNKFEPSWDVWRKGVNEQMFQFHLDEMYPAYAHQITLADENGDTVVAFTCFNTIYNQYKLKDAGKLVEDLSKDNMPWVCQGVTKITVGEGGEAVTTYYQVSGILRVSVMATNTFYITYIDPANGTQTALFTAAQCVDRMTKLHREIMG